jgi:hypothetical protein
MEFCHTENLHTYRRANWNAYAAYETGILELHHPTRRMSVSKILLPKICPVITLVRIEGKPLPLVVVLRRRTSRTARDGRGNYLFKELLSRDTRVVRGGF